MSCFVAIDFETADARNDSACSVGLVRVEDGKIIDTRHFLIRPPRKTFAFTWIHGIAWKHVENEPTFGELWPQIDEFCRGSDFLAAHNAPFDRRVLQGCCEAYGVAPPETPFLCTVRLARSVWDIRPTKLPNVCDHLGIKLKHHEALSDAEACAKIVLAAIKEGAFGEGIPE